MSLKSFVKWAGGKKQLLPEILKHIPKSYNTYIEPFVGGGALFFALSPKKAILGDMNERLMRTYSAIKHNPNKIIELLNTYPYDKQFYYTMRNKNTNNMMDYELAAYFIYLNKTGFNGLYRVNKKNEFNVPFGKYKNPKICDQTNLLMVSKVLENTELFISDFETICNKAVVGDFVYFDPPYVPISKTSSFTSYTSGQFGEADHIRLRDIAKKLKLRGVNILLSNSSADFVKELYKDFEIIEIYGRRSINSHGEKRGVVKELLIK